MSNVMIAGFLAAPAVLVGAVLAVVFWAVFHRASPHRKVEVDAVEPPERQPLGLRLRAGWSGLLLRAEAEADGGMDRVADFVSRHTAVFLLLIVAAIVATIGLKAWEWLEPLTGVATLALAGKAVLQTRKAAKARYQQHDGEEFILVVQFKRPLVEAIRARFGRAPDLTILVSDLVGSSELTRPEHWEAVVRAAYQAICTHQNKRVLIASDGPGQLWGLLGQLLGVDRFSVEFLGFFKGQIDTSAPPASGTWMT